MKKVFLFFFLMASVIVNGAADLFSSPIKFLDALLVPQRWILTIPITEISQIDVGLFERDVTGFIFEKSFMLQPAIFPEDNLVILKNATNQSNIFVVRNTKAILQATSPKCRAVIKGYSATHLSTMFATSTVIQAVSPNCRDVT